MGLNEIIRKAMKDSPFGPEELSRKSGIHPVNLSQFKAGDRTLSLASLEKLAAALGVDIMLAKKSKK